MPNSPKEDSRHTDKEEIKHQIGQRHKMIEKETKKLDELKDGVAQKIVEHTNWLTWLWKKQNIRRAKQNCSKYKWKIY